MVNQARRLGVEDLENWERTDRLLVEEEIAKLHELLKTARQQVLLFLSILRFRVFEKIVSLICLREISGKRAGSRAEAARTGTAARVEETQGRLAMRRS